MLTSVHWLWEMKKTRAKGSERPLLSAANKLLAWYMWARSWNTCFSGREREWDGMAWDGLWDPVHTMLELNHDFKGFLAEG